MKQIDFLFIRDKHANINLDFFDDIELSCLRSILSTVEFDLFTNVLKKPLVEQDKIYERQNIFKDLMAYPQVASHLISICDEVQNNKIPRHDLIYGKSSLKQKLLEYLKVINKNLDVPEELLSALSNKEFHSESLSNLSKQLEIKDDIDKIKEILNRLARNILDDNISLQISFGTTFKLKSASVYSIGAKQSSSPKRGIFNRKQNTGGTPYGYDFIADLQIGQMLESAVKNISHIISQLNFHILQFCSNLSMQLSFYHAGIKIIKYLQSTGIRHEFPKISVSKDKIQMKNLLDVGLVVKRGSSIDVIANDFKGAEKSFYLISGVNQGGKTTFLKSIGVAQIFAQNGLPVAALEYVCPIFKNFVSHFPRGEDNQLHSGKLEEELSRFKRDLPLMTKDALILMNESFATTTENEGAKIAADTLRALSVSQPLLFFVTHNFTLLKNRKEYCREFENGISFQSLVTIKSISSSERTYKLEEGEPQEEIETMEFLKGKYIK